MNQYLLQKIQKLFVFFIIIFLPFTNFPKKFSLSFIENNASYYIMLILIALFLFEYFKYKFKINKIIFTFFIIYVLSQIISLVHGLIIYPYYNIIDLSQLPKLQYICDRFDISVDKNIIGIYLFVRETKNIILNSLTLCFLPLLFVHLFSNDWEKCFSFVAKSVVALVCLLCLYSIPEIIYLKFNNIFAQKILETINPFLYDVGLAYNYWPPLLWNGLGGQLRSLMPEPSHFSIVANFCIPFLLYFIYRTFSFKYIVLCAFFMFMLFMSKSRTGMLLFVIENLILLSFFIFNFNKKNLKFLIVLFSCIFFSMLLNLTIPNKIDRDGLDRQTISNNDDSKLVNYIDENLISVTNLNKGSSNNRFVIANAMLKVGLSNPFLGVGEGLRSAYIVDNIPEFEIKSEVQIWVNSFKEKGFKAVIPNFNQYVYFFAENGLLGLILFILPVIYIFYKISKNKSLLLNFNFILILIAFIGQLVAMLAGRYLITYPVTLGLMFVCFDNMDNKKEKEKYE